MRTLVVAISVYMAMSGVSKAYVLVEDIPNLTTNIVNEAKNYTQYVTTAMRELTQIENQATQIENQVIALERFGNPNYYVHLLNLDSFMATSSRLVSGVGQTISAYRGAASGLSALQYTGQGIYSNFSNNVDRWGNTVRYSPDPFKKFGTVFDMAESYNTDLRNYDTETASLQQQLANAMFNLNQANTQMASDKYSSQVNAISAQINQLGHNTTLSGQRVTVQNAVNQADAARSQEASRQQTIQERQEDLQNEAQANGTYIGFQP